jgi:hypothetical protein
MWCRKVLLPQLRALQRQLFFLNLPAAFTAFAFYYMNITIRTWIGAGAVRVAVLKMA